MEVKQYIFYNVALNNQDVADLLNAIDKVFVNYTTRNKVEEVEPLLRLKDAIVLAANKD